jgi:hypothetical protein
MTGRGEYGTILLSNEEEGESMSQTYLENRVEEALVKAKGNQTKARKLVAEMAVEDSQLLLALTKPYLSAVISYVVARVAANAGKKKGDVDDLPLVPEIKGSKGGGIDFGLDLLKALGGGHNVAKFGKEDSAPPIAKKAASQQHVNALKLMASKSKTKPVK